MSLPSGNIQETLFVPLWGRAFATRKFPELLKDHESVRIVNETEYDFERISSSKEYYNLASAARAANFDREIKEYIAKYPEATVVSIGSGLDTTFFRVDNGKINWYDLDLPEIIELRRKYISSSERVNDIAQSCFNYSWMEKVRYEKQKGLIFIVGGVFYYFMKEQVIEFVRIVSESFPGAAMIFDVTSNFGLRISNRYVKRTGNTGALMHFSLNDVGKFAASVSPDIIVGAEYPFYKCIKINRHWSFNTRFMMRISDWTGSVKLVRLEF